MSFRPVLSALPMLLFAVSTAAAAEPVAVTRTEASWIPPDTDPVGALWATDFLDPRPISRFHLVTRATFSDGSSVVSNASAWSYEARGAFDVTKSVALTATFPVGLVSNVGGSPSRAFIGNVAIGATAGGTFTSGPRTRFRAGGGFDTYLPTAPEAGRFPEAEGLVGAIRSSEPQLYVRKMLSFRLRGHAELSNERWAAAVELGLVPGFTLSGNTEAQILLSAAGRFSILATPLIEPFFEVGTTTQIAGNGDISPPILFTPGVRFHFGEVFDPAVFVSMNAVASKAVIFGVDLAAALREAKGVGSKRDFEEFMGEDRGDSTDDFLDGM